ncbi:MAG: branched-chain amino acid ABC transporter substrate-binding protein [Chloroflexi bacterium]|nr:branched-chain amino acid ABC transporter substrate-binding protein [Chloroflexota bacterium]MCL5075319.1 branched-chain amino acid ABC transporter substrate-binding protein [Chloroflexota bacterium]
MLVVLIGGLGIAALPQQDGWKGIIKVGSVLPFYGYDVSTAPNALMAMKLAIGEWNQRGGVEGYRIELVSVDDENDPKVAAYQAKEMIVDPVIMGVVGHLSSDSALAAVGDYHQAGLALITIGATASGLTEYGYPEVFQMVADDRLRADKAVGLLINKYGLKRLAIIWEQSPGYVEAAHTLATVATGRMAIVVQGQVPGRPRNFAPLLEQMAQAKVEGVFFSGSFQQAAALAVELKNVLPKVVFLVGSDCDTADFVKIGEAAVDGTLYLSRGVVDLWGVEKTGGFTRNFQDYAQLKPLGVAALAYDATNILLQAIALALHEDGNLNRERVVASLHNIGAYQGVTGAIAFDKMGRSRHPLFYIYGIESGRYPGRVILKSE